jgi:hypothetical protein
MKTELLDVGVREQPRDRGLFENPRLVTAGWLASAVIVYVAAFLFLSGIGLFAAGYL